MELGKGLVGVAYVLPYSVIIMLNIGAHNPQVGREEHVFALQASLQVAVAWLRQGRLVGGTL